MTPPDEFDDLVELRALVEALAVDDPTFLLQFEIWGDPDEARTCFWCHGGDPLHMPLCPWVGARKALGK